ncbi:hypothetical protein OAI47_03345 [Rhodospirillaceae bacterium]|nr:hypothetical protein [Rhodospirillaceae bacterium]
MFSLIIPFYIFMITVVASLTPYSATLEAAELRSTDRNHYSSGVKKRSRGTFSGQGRKFRTRILQAPKKGLMASDPNPLYQAASFDKDASIACNKGRLRRFGGGVVEFSGVRYPAATKKDMSRIEGIELQEGIYIFLNEGSSDCKVFFMQQ